MYRIIIARSVLEDYRKLPHAVVRKIETKIAGLTTQPRPIGAIKLSGMQDYYRLRVGDYRVIYTIQEKIVTITIVRVGHRKDIYERDC